MLLSNPLHPKCSSPQHLFPSSGPPEASKPLCLYEEQEKRSLQDKAASSETHLMRSPQKKHLTRKVIYGKIPNMLNERLEPTGSNDIPSQDKCTNKESDVSYSLNKGPFRRIKGQESLKEDGQCQNLPLLSAPSQMLLQPRQNKFAEYHLR